MARFPAVNGRLGLGVGLDLPWGAPIGLEEAGPTDRVLRFLEAHGADFTYLFASWQPRGRGRLALADYAPAFDALFGAARRLLSGGCAVRALHHTALNLGATERYDRAALLDFTNALVARYDLRWVNEDLGLWSLGGRPLPYPLPPWLTDAGLAASIRNVDEAQRGLDVPLLVEFPGFSEGVSLYVGRWDAYDFFRRVVEDTGSACTLDTGHLLSWQWLRGRRGEALYDELDRLPLASCFEVHLSGCEIVGGRFMDYHHGVLMDEQLELLRRLVPLCPNLRAITYEDPKFGVDGRLARRAVPGFEALRALVAA